MLAFLLTVQAPSHVEKFRIEGVERRALVFPGAGAAPHALILVFHGHGGSMNGAARSFRSHTYWPEATVIYLDGLPSPGALTDPKGTRQGWQTRVGQSSDRDLKFVDAILDRVKNVDGNRIYAMGHSNGGRFTYVLWSARSNAFAAYGVSCSPAILQPAPAFAIAGVNDRLVSYAAQKRSIDLIAGIDGAVLSTAKPDGTVRLARGRDGLEVGTFLHLGGHNYPAQGAQATVELFKRHAKRP